MSNPSLTQHQRDERLWALIAHLSPFLGIGFIGPLVIMLAKPHQSEFTYHHAKQQLILQLVLLVCWVIAGILCLVIIGFFLLPVLAIIQIVGPIIGAIRANEGAWYRFPIIGGSG